MIKYEKKTLETSVPVKMVCNKSGKEVDIENEDNYVEQNLMHKFRISFGYGSDFDMDTWEFDLNENEILEFIRTFKIRPEGFAEGAKYPDKVFKEWCETGVHNWKSGWTKEDHEEEKRRNERIDERMSKARELFKKLRDRD